MGKNLKFGEAIEAVKDGKLIAREGWNGKGMFVFQRPADSLQVGFIVNTVKSLPQALKDYIKTQYDYQETVQFSSYLCMKAADGSIVSGWLASQTDMLAEDWCILN